MEASRINELLISKEKRDSLDDKEWNIFYKAVMAVHKENLEKRKQKYEDIKSKKNKV